MMGVYHTISRLSGPYRSEIFAIEGVRRTLSDRDALPTYREVQRVMTKKSRSVPATQR